MGCKWRRGSCRVVKQLGQDSGARAAFDWVLWEISSRGDQLFSYELITEHMYRLISILWSFLNSIFKKCNISIGAHNSWPTMMLKMLESRMEMPEAEFSCAREENGRIFAENQWQFAKNQQQPVDLQSMSHAITMQWDNQQNSKSPLGSLSELKDWIRGRYVQESSSTTLIRLQ